MCLRDMHSSQDPLTFIRCGHMMHESCFASFSLTNVACPICRKSIVDMLLFEQQLDLQMEAMQMPDEYRDKMMIV